MAHTHKLVDASYIHHFADRRPREAQGLLPDIIRRLLEDTPGVKGLTAPGGDGILTHGWDICVDDAPASHYLPGGQSRWELGTSLDPTKKATHDYTDRMSRRDQLGVDPSETTVVFVSMRRWPTKISWRDRHRAEGIWRSVDVKDAHDICDWLATKPAVHLWVTERIRGSIDGASFIPPSQLPYDVSDFVGRQCELDSLVAAADRANSVVLTGQPGIGKTALAVHFAHRHTADFPDGQLYVDLRGTDTDPATPETVLTGFLRALGEDDSHDRGLDDKLHLYRSLCHNKRFLLVLDNAADEKQVRSLLPSGPHCLALVTSRSSLSGLDNVHRIQLETLQQREALDMLAAITSAERVSAEYPASAQICELCGFLPLALRIAGTLATKRRGWSLNNLAHRLEGEHRRLDQLKVGDIAVRASFHLSYRRLEPNAQLVFRRIALVPGPDFNLDHLDRATRGEAGEDLDDQLELLAELNLIGYGNRDGRYTIHDLLRLYAEETLRSTEPGSSVEAASREVLSYLLGTATEFSTALNPETPVYQGGEHLNKALEWLDDNIGNVVPAHTLAIKQNLYNLATGAAVSLNMYFSRRHIWSTAIVLIESTLKLIRDTRQLPGYQHERAARVEFILLQGLCSAALGCRNYSLATSACDQIDELGVRAGITHAPFVALNHRGQVCQQQRQYAQALSYYEESLRLLLQEDGPPELESILRHNIGIARSNLGQTDEGLADLRHDLGECRRRGDTQGEAHTLNSIGLALSRAGDAHGAEQALREAIEKFVECQDIREEANAQNDLGIVLSNRLDRPEEALECHRRDLEVCEQLEDHRGSAQAHIQIASCLVSLEEVDAAQAADHLDKASTLVDVETDPTVVAHVSMVQGDLHRACDQVELALAAYTEAITLTGKSGDSASHAMCKSRRGDLLANVGRNEAALADLTAAVEFFTAENFPGDEAVVRESLAQVATRADDPN